MSPVRKVSSMTFPVRKLNRKEDLIVSKSWWSSISYQAFFCVCPPATAPFPGFFNVHKILDKYTSKPLFLQSFDLNWIFESTNSSLRWIGMINRLTSAAFIGISLFIFDTCMTRFLTWLRHRLKFLDHVCVWVLLSLCVFFPAYCTARFRGYCRKPWPEYASFFAMY